MNFYSFVLICVVFLCVIARVSGRALFYDDNQKELDFEYPSSKRSSRIETSHHEREIHRRSAIHSARSSHTRQEFIEMLQKAYKQGWKPSLKHYVPGTRFGRHRR